MNTVFEILKYILPALVVFATAYYILKKFLDAKYHLEVLEYQKSIANTKLPLKLQAYERLMLFLERIDINTLIFRLNSSEITGKQLSNSMLISVQKEYEHNLAQQLYISDSLWKIIGQAKDNVLALISESAMDLNHEATNANFINAVLANNQAATSSLEIAKSAIREETKTLLQ